MELPTITNQYLSSSSSLPERFHSGKRSSSERTDVYHSTLIKCGTVNKKRGIYSYISMKAAGFEYTNHGDRARCSACGLEVSGWTSDMKPFAIHLQRSPTCAFVRSMVPSQLNTISQTTDQPPIPISSTDDEKSTKRQKTETTDSNAQPIILVEVDTLKQVRKRTFSHWPHRTSPSTSQMIDAGFFNCNVGDRVICIYCNIICQQWTPNSDDPCQVHKALSPKCPYVISMLNRSQASSILVINQQSTTSQAASSTNIDPVRSNAIVYTAACNTAYIEIPKRNASFATWPNDNLPSVDDLVKAGFFFTGTKTTVTCFYCNGSLQNWGSNDNPTIEHARWFPHCAYVKQLCGAELYRKIQESKRAQQERANANASSNRSGTSNVSWNGGRLMIPDESTLSRLVAARLDLPISQSLLDRQFKLSIIKRCWEDQLRLKHDDFVSDSDLLVACRILQKQIEHIDGKKENIIVPSVAMAKIREKEEADNLSRTNIGVSLRNNNIGETGTHEEVTSELMSTNSSEDDGVEMTTSSSESNLNSTTSSSCSANKEEKKEVKGSGTNGSGKNNQDEASPAHPCVLCLSEEKRLACIPCGHLATCVPCGHSLLSCPICRRSIDAFVRVYI